MKPPTAVDRDGTNMRTRKPMKTQSLIQVAYSPRFCTLMGRSWVKIWNMWGDGEMRPGVIKSGWDELHYSLEFGGRYGFFSKMCRKKIVCMHFFPKCSFPELIVSQMRSRCFFISFISILSHEGKQWINHGTCQNRRAWLAQCQFQAKSLSFTCVVLKYFEAIFYYV